MDEGLVLGARVCCRTACEWSPEQKGRQKRATLSDRAWAVQPWVQGELLESSFSVAKETSGSLRRWEQPLDKAAKRPIPRAQRA
jgi:hypothetical protein